MRRRYKILSMGAFLALVLDQCTKWLVLQHIPQHHAIPLVQGFFDLVHVRNRGAAFGFLNRSDIDWQVWLFGGATLLATGAILMLTRSAKEDTRLFVGFSLILGGAFGNLIDRLRFRSVIDFLDVYIGAWHWPAFNVADIAICLGAFLACLSLWHGETLKGKNA